MDDRALNDFDPADRRSSATTAIVCDLAERPVQPAVLRGFDDDPRLVQAEALNHDPAPNKVAPREGNFDLFGLRCRRLFAAGAAGDPYPARDNTRPRQEPVDEWAIYDELASRRLGGDSDYGRLEMLSVDQQGQEHRDRSQAGRYGYEPQELAPPRPLHSALPLREAAGEWCRMFEGFPTLLWQGTFDRRAGTLPTCICIGS